MLHLVRSLSGYDFEVIETYSEEDSTSVQEYAKYSADNIEDFIKKLSSEKAPDASTITIDDSVSEQNATELNTRLGITKIKPDLGEVADATSDADIPRTANQQLTDNVLKILLDESDAPNFSDVNGKRRLIESVLCSKNPVLLLMFKKSIEEKMREFASLANNQKNDVDLRNRVRLTIDNLSAYLPFCEPGNGTQMQLPSWSENDNCFKQANFLVQHIQLTKGQESSPYTAYGLIPQSGSDAQARVMFSGTTLPTFEGFLKTLKADTTPIGGVGRALYENAQEYLQPWIANMFEQTGKKVHLVGQSLGGAMSLQTHLRQPNYTSFTAAVPPYLTGYERDIYNKAMRITNADQNESPSIEIASSSSAQNSGNVVQQVSDALSTGNVVLRHADDPVSKIGTWLPPNTEVITFGNKDEKGILMAHAASINPSKEVPLAVANRVEATQGRRDTFAHLFPKYARPFGFIAASAVGLLSRLYRKVSGESVNARPAAY